MATGTIQPGRRVWVADNSAPNGRAPGRIASIDEGFLRFCPQGASDALRTPRT
jgi:hypothetical protein